MTFIFPCPSVDSVAMLTLDIRMKKVATELGIEVLE